MTDRAELLEAALDSFPEGIALLDLERTVLLWNPSAETITGEMSVDLVSRTAPEALQPLLRSGVPCGDSPPGASEPLEPCRGALVHIRHKLGHDVPVMARIMILRDGLGGRIGAAIVFHPAESLDALPHGDNSEGDAVASSQADLEERLAIVYEDFTRGGVPFGILWITVDQAQELRKTHGARACEAMLDAMEHTLRHGLRPTEELGRWGDNEFLVLSHERTPEMLAAHAQVLTGQARTADFRWWGDRASLTVSIGAAQAEEGDTLAQLLRRAQTAMTASIHAGGNHVTSAPGRQACLPS